jgi:hypothetical protein
MKKLLLLLSFGLASAFVVPCRSFAAVMTLQPALGDPQAITVQLDAQGKSINAVQAHFTFDTNSFYVSNINTGGSIVSLWIDPPVFSNTAGTVDFAGIIPAGESTSAATIITIVIVPKAVNSSGDFIFGSGQVLLNDGKGTPATFSVVSNPFPLVGEKTASTTVDTQPPDPFTPQIAQDPNVFNGQYFLVFSTTDQQTGIDHYDVLEVPAGTIISPSSPWQSGTSPYLLKDQALSSDIYVRAVDEAGNFRIAELPAPHSHPSIPRPQGDFLVIILLIGVAIASAIIFSVQIWKKQKRERLR